MQETKPTVQHIDRASRELTKEEFCAILLECYQMAYETPTTSSEQHHLCLRISESMNAQPKPGADGWTVCEEDAPDCTVVSYTPSRETDGYDHPLYLYQDHATCQFKVTEFSPSSYLE